VDASGDLRRDGAFGEQGEDAGQVLREAPAKLPRALGSVWTFLDLTPLGRQEEWEDTPPGRPQTPPYGRWRLHDEYETS
jgi:predicted dithiol-disulfide oxidoreductase (DUF899 family)